MISGEEEAVTAIAECFAARGVRTKRLLVSHAFHSPRMDPMLEEFRSVAESVSFSRPKVALVSNVTGELAGDEVSTAEYWVKQVRGCVRFADGVRTLGQAGVGRFVELGPKPTLLGLVPASLGETQGREAVLLASLRPELGSETQAVFEALSGYYAHGGSVDWKGVFPQGGRRVELPTYAWQRQRYWLESSGLQGRSGEATGHPLLGVRVPAAGSQAVYESVVSRVEEAWLYDHRAMGKALVPGAGLAELMRAAGEQAFETSAIEVSGVVFQAPLMLPERGGQRVQVVLEQGEDGAQATVYSQAASAKVEDTWTPHASAQVRPARDVAGAKVDWASVEQRCTEAVDVERVYEEFAALGMEYGPCFRGLRFLARGEGEVLGKVELPEGVVAAEHYGFIRRCSMRRFRRSSA